MPSPQLGPPLEELVLVAVEVLPPGPLLVLVELVTAPPPLPPSPPPPPEPLASPPEQPATWVRALAVMRPMASNRARVECASLGEVTLGQYH
jgi:hypothetical protein